MFRVLGPVQPLGVYKNAYKNVFYNALLYIQLFLYKENIVLYFSAKIAKYKYQNLTSLPEGGRITFKRY